MKSPSECSFTSVNSASSALFALSCLPRLRFSTACQRADRECENDNAGVSRRGAHSINKRVACFKGQPGGSLGAYLWPPAQTGESGAAPCFAHSSGV
ncbi:hypothetical protein CXL00_17810 [Stutzerimonas stutzeri]|uniref:Uncharacterized protein n=1 Tax=Stutzerimonas stutzeri TaxID=316 RepID=A0A2N8SNG8_STUST|nr:hypothetical protein CXL00_17810 [Stutzerimonas stutzeri]